MKIGITTFGCDAGRSGIGRMLLAMLDALELRQDDHEYVIWSTHSDAPIWQRDNERFRLRTVADRWGGATASVLWHQTLLYRECNREGLDAIWFPAANRRLAAWAPCGTVGSVLDLASLHLPSKYSWKHDLYLRHVLPRMVNRLDEIVTISEYSKRDIVAATGCDPERVQVIPLGVDHTQFFPSDASCARIAVRNALGIDDPYLLYVSRLEHPAKNHVRLIEAFESLVSDYQLPHHLLFAGPDWNRADVVHARIAESPLRSRIHVSGFVSQSLIPDLYRAADLCVIPSLYEGFGMPVVEAMACGTPVVLSNRTSLPEVAGGHAGIFEPDDIEDMCDSIARGLLDTTWRDNARLGGLEHASHFRWDQTAEQTLQRLARSCGQALVPISQPIEKSPLASPSSSPLANESAECAGVRK